jgi:hypothetical protein
MVKVGDLYLLPFNDFMWIGWACPPIDWEKSVCECVFINPTLNFKYHWSAIVSKEPLHSGVFATGTVERTGPGPWQVPGPVPVLKKDLALYTHWPYKSKRFWDLLKTVDL